MILTFCCCPWVASSGDKIVSNYVVILLSTDGSGMSESSKISASSRRQFHQS